jgi:hypothetical protein
MSGARTVLPSTVERVPTVLVTAMVLIAVMFVVVVATLALAAHAHRRRRLDDARAQARYWVERLGGELLLLDGAAARLGTGSAAGLAEAAERFTAASAELVAARTPRQCRIAQDTAVEGLHHVRTARRSLRLDPGPRVPGQGVGAVLRAALEDGAWSIPRLVDDVLAEAHWRARQLPGATMEPAEWIRRGQLRWMRGGNSSQIVRKPAPAPREGEGGPVDPDRVLRHNLHGAVVENDRLRG